MHLNIRSLLPKIDEIRCLLMNCKVGIFCLTETWIDSSVTNNEIKVDNYNVIRKDRNRQGGGVCIFIRSDINFNVLDIMWSWSYCSWIYCCLRLSLYYLEFAIVHPAKIIFMRDLSLF